MGQFRKSSVIENKIIDKVPADTGQIPVDFPLT